MNQRAYDEQATEQLGDLSNCGDQQNTARSVQAATSAGNEEVSALSDVDNVMVSDPASRRRSFELLRASPCKSSRSYLVPFTDHLVMMSAKHYSYRDMQDWFEAHHGYSPSTSTLHHFFHVILKKMRRAESERKAIEASNVPSNSPPSAVKPKNIDGRENKHNQLARDAIRAVKERTSSTEAKATTPAFQFDENKPLITNPKPKH